MSVAVRREAVQGVNARWLQTVLRVTLRLTNHTGQEISVALVGRATSARLNQQYRHRPGPTNILSFPYARAAGNDTLLGELIFCVPLILTEAKRYSRSVRHHTALLAVHGVLHLLGLDHQHPAAERRMAARERSLLRQLARRSLLRL